MVLVAQPALAGAVFGVFHSGVGQARAFAEAPLLTLEKQLGVGPHAVLDVAVVGARLLHVYVALPVEHAADDVAAAVRAQRLDGLGEVSDDGVDRVSAIRGPRRATPVGDGVGEDDVVEFLGQRAVLRAALEDDDTAVNALHFGREHTLAEETLRLERKRQPTVNGIEFDPHAARLINSTRLLFNCFIPSTEDRFCSAHVTCSFPNSLGIKVKWPVTQPPPLTDPGVRY